VTAVVVLVLLLLIVSVVLRLWLRNPRQQTARQTRSATTWRALQAADRINAAHWRATQMMRAEAERAQREYQAFDPFRNSTDHEEYRPS
jgi:hypothetical protein